MAADEKKRYWLKLDKDFLKSPHIKVIKNMANGKDYVLFYLSLMLESVETVGHLRFSELIPYNEEMLASITDTNIDIVRSAVKMFSSLGLIQLLDDGTIFLQQVAKMTGKESESAERVRQFRQRKLENDQKALPCNGDVTDGNGDVTKSNDNKEEQRTENREQNTENNEQRITNNKERKTARFCKPSVSEINEYCIERNSGISAQAFFDHYEANGWMVGKSAMKNWKAAIRTWESRRKEQGGGVDRQAVPDRYRTDKDYDAPFFKD